MSEKQSYLEQINKYYEHTLRTFDVIKIGMTSDVLVEYGASKLPMIMSQSTLTKCVRKHTGSRSAHELPRNVIETLPEQIQNPIFLIQDKERRSIVLITDTKDKEKNSILIAIKLGERKDSIAVNEIKSIYGKTNLKEYLLKHIGLSQLHIINNKKAEMLSRVIGLQLPKALIASSHNKTVPSTQSKVNTKKSVLEKLHNFQKEIDAQDTSKSEKYPERNRDR